MITISLFYLVGIPLSILWHEVGHATGIIIFTKSQARVFLGPVNESNKNLFRIGRIYFHIKWSYSGYCDIKINNATIAISKFQQAMISVCGPVSSLLLTILTFYISDYTTYELAKEFFNGIAILNLLLFFCTIIPIRYPNWWKPYGGKLSDGYLFLRALRTK